MASPESPAIAAFNPGSSFLVALLLPAFPSAPPSSEASGGAAWQA